MRKLPQRKLNRKRDHDYSSPGAYFVTFNIHRNLPDQKFFGEIIDQKMHLNRWGKIAQAYWLEIPEHYDEVYLDQFTIMPDHIHGIIILVPDEKSHERLFPDEGSFSPERTEQCSVRSGEKGNPGEEKNHHYGKLSKIIKSFKNAVSKEIHASGRPDFRWHRSFHDRIIRSPQMHYRIQWYIIRNPIKHGGAGWTEEIAHGQNNVLSVSSRRSCLSARGAANLGEDHPSDEKIENPPSQKEGAA